MAQDTLPARIVCYPDPRLRQTCKPVEVFDERLAALVERMCELMKKGPGVGLAGPQVGIARRLFVCNPTGNDDDNRVYINPELIDLVGNVEGEEGCLSLPDIRVGIRRGRVCTIRAQNLKGEVFEQVSEDLLARIWQHETDHLDGRLIIDRMNTTDRLANKKLLAQLEKDYYALAKKAVR